jgi:uncharacterized protein (DUF3820 family)
MTSSITLHRLTRCASPQHSRTEPYLNWFARTGFPSGKIGHLLALMQELDHNGLSALLDPLRKQ